MTDKASAAPAAPGNRRYVLAMLIVIYTCNFVDRSILGVLGQPIKEELHLADWQLGVLGGLAFAILYSALGIPIARLSERKNRVTILAVATTVWSIMTAVCAGAANFWHLMLARIGVGIGEAGCIPPSFSLMSDYFPPRQRATAAGLFALAAPVGTVTGAIIGAMVAQRHGWRAAFLVVGAPGLLLALILKLTVREPPRGALDPEGSAVDTPSLMTVVRQLAGKPTFIHLAAGSSLASFSGYAISAFAIPLILRGFPLSLTQASTMFGLIGGAAAAVGVVAGGLITDRVGRKDARYYALIPAVGFILAAPLYMLAFSQATAAALAAMLVAPLVLHYIYLGPMGGLCQNMVGPRARATSQAIMTLIINLIGLGLGPAVVGWGSDLLASAAYAGVGDFVSACPGGQAIKGATAAAAEACRLASFTGLQQALIAASAIYVWAGVHFLLAARTVREDVTL